jgi:hypothetical protein
MAAWRGSGAGRIAVGYRKSNSDHIRRPVPHRAVGVPLLRAVFIADTLDDGPVGLGRLAAFQEAPNSI